MNDEVKDLKSALDGARYILMERFAEDAQLLAKLRHYLTQNATLESKVIEGKEEEGAKFRDYFNYSEQFKKIPSHRALAILRGRNEGILNISLNADPEQDDTIRTSFVLVIVKKLFVII